MAAPMDPVAPMDPIEAPVLAPTIPQAGPLKAPMDTQPAPAQVTYRGFGDPVAEREAIYQHALLGLQGKKLGNDQVHLEVLNPHYKTPYEPRVRDAKKAVLEGGSLQRRLYGTVRLTDTQTGQLLDEQETVLAHIPHMNQRGLFVRNGTEWLGRGQQRLRSGIYGRKASDGSTQVQVNARRGRGFLLALEPESGLFKINVGQSTTRLYPVLRALGVSDDTLKAKWGDELFKKNWRGISGNDQKDLAKLVAKLGGPKDQGVPVDQLPAKLHEILGRTEIDPEVSEATTGRAISRLSHEELLHLTDKVLKTARGETPEDNRDSQAYQSAHGAEDFIRERLERDRAGSLRKLLWKATREKSLKGMPSGLLTPNIDALFQGSGLFVGTEDINPLEIHDLRHGLIRTGEGGMSPDAVSRDARNVQTSYLGFIDPSRTPDSAAIGLDLRVTGAALKGSDNKLYTPLRNVRTGKTELLPALPLEKKVVAFPGEMAKPGEWVHGVKAGQLQYVKKSEVEYELPGMSSLLNPTTRLIPDPGGMKSQRLLMGTRMTGQAMPLEDPEAPLVQSANDDGTSLHSTLGKVLGAVHAKGPGVVQSVTPDAITIKYQDGHTEEHDLYNNYAHSRKTMSHNTPVVKPGDTVGANQLIARSNFTDKNGQMALGRNLRAGWMMAKGHTFEDSFVISESAAKKLTSQHLYQHDLGLDDIQTTKTSDYQQIYGPRFKRDQYAKLGDDGVIKVGQEVQPGDPLILGVGKKPLRAIGAVMQTARSGTSDRSEVWGHQAPGIVTDVAHGKDGIKVTVRSYNTTALSDKVSDRFGAKGVISKIVPDHKMPHDEQGRPLEILINANGIVSRGNPATLANAVLGKVAEKTGNPYVIQPFANHGKMTEFALEEARKHGVKILEDLTDPETGKKIPGVQTGIQYVMKLHHVAESKVSARDQAAYDIFGAPAKGGESGSKHMGGLELNALLSHGATGFIKDAKLVRGQRNEDYWRALRHGDTPLTPGRSFANEHFQELLRAAGVNLRHEGTRTKLAPMLDHDVLQRAPHEIQSAETFDWKTMRPIPGGLFDPKATGGADGTQWGRIALGARIPHPLFEIPVIKLLGITRKSLDEVLAGREQLHGKTGPEAIEAGLKAISTDRETERLKQVVRTGAQTKRDDAVKALGYLAGLKKMGLTPDQLMISQIPVLPPKFRPIARTDKMDITHDLNYLYGDLLEARKNHQDTLKTVGQAGDQYLTMYRAAKAVSSMYGPVGQKSAEQGVKGVLGFALGKGESPKGSVYHRRVLGNSLDTVGRGAITAAPELDMDQVRLPPRIAWPAFRPYVIRKLVQSGLSAQEAVQHVKDKTHRARLALDQVMGERPVVYNRAPSLHRYSSAGAWSTLGPDGDDSIGMNYVTEKGLGADHDGDALNVHIPNTDEAVKDVIEKLMPSKNLLSSATGEAHFEPQQDYVVGLHLATRVNPDKPVRKFATRQDAERAYRAGEITLQDPIEILQR